MTEPEYKHIPVSDSLLYKYMLENDNDLDSSTDTEDEYNNVKMPSPVTPHVPTLLHDIGFDKWHNTYCLMLHSPEKSFMTAGHHHTGWQWILVRKHINDIEPILFKSYKPTQNWWVAGFGEYRFIQRYVYNDYIVHETFYKVPMSSSIVRVSEDWITIPDMNRDKELSIDKLKEDTIYQYTSRADFSNYPPSYVQALQQAADRMLDD
jgi:hypothetical protein